MSKALFRPHTKRQSSFGAAKSTDLEGHAFVNFDFVKFVKSGSLALRNTSENCPAKYLANESAKQLYPLNNIESTARALYSQPKLFWEVFGPFFKNFPKSLA